MMRVLLSLASTIHWSAGLPGHDATTIGGDGKVMAAGENLGAAGSARLDAASLAYGGFGANDKFQWLDDDVSLPYDGGCVSHEFTHTHVHTASTHDGMTTTTTTTTATKITRCPSDLVAARGEDAAKAAAMLTTDGIDVGALFPAAFADRYAADSAAEALHCIDFAARGGDASAYPSYAAVHVVHSLPDGFTKAARSEIIAVAEAVSRMTGAWDAPPNKPYDIPDMSVTHDFPARAERRIRALVARDVLPRMAVLAGVDVDGLVFCGADVIKYDGDTPGRQVALDAHVDSSTWSFTVTLNDGFAGGGTHFLGLNATVRGTTSSLVMHWGGLEHEGLPTTAGVRYLLVGFV